jgi:hypothetical protein
MPLNHVQQEAIMRKFLLAIASLLLMLCNVSHAVPINANLLKITSVSFNPKTQHTDSIFVAARAASRRPCHFCCK